MSAKDFRNALSKVAKKPMINIKENHLEELAKQVQSGEVVQNDFETNKPKTVQDLLNNMFKK